MNRMDELLSGRYEIVAFRDLPVPYQLAMAHFMAIDGSAWDALGGVEDAGSADELDAALRRALPLYVSKYGDREFGVALLPAGDVQKAVMSDEDIQGGHDGWEAYHAWYAGSGSDVPEYAATDRWPVILSSDDFETLRDGWHRFHSYVRSGHPDIPAVFFPDQRHLDVVAERATKSRDLRDAIQAIHDALEDRWEKAGRPVHSTELCLWDMQRFLDCLDQDLEPRDVLADAMGLLEEWIESGAEARPSDTLAIQLASQVLAAGVEPKGASLGM